MVHSNVYQIFHWSRLTEPAAGAPSAPVDVSSSVVSANSVLLSWNPPPASDSSCPPATYTITITTAYFCLHQMVINTTDSTINRTLYGLTQGLEYFFTVAGVDAGERVGEYSATSNITMTS